MWAPQLIFNAHLDLCHPGAFPHAGEVESDPSTFREGKPCPLKSRFVPMIQRRETKRRLRRSMQIRKNEHDVAIETLLIDSLRGHLDRAANYVRTYRNKDRQNKVILGPPPIDFVRDLLSLPDWPTDVFPVLKGIVHSPVFSSTGNLIDRPGYSGPTPMGALTAPAAATGKGRLASCLSIPALGQLLPITTAPTQEEEWQKSLTSLLAQYPQFVLFDNVKVLRSAALEAALTADVWSGRALGTNDMIQVPISCVWLLTGNNLQIEGDLPRRIVGIRLDAKMERPEERDPKMFRHGLPQWALEIVDGENPVENGAATMRTLQNRPSLCQL